MPVGVKSRACPRTGRECDCTVDLATEAIVCRADELTGSRPTVVGLSLEMANARVNELVAPRVTKEYIESRIAKVDYFRSDILTVCVITMLNGFREIGRAAPASPENYDPQVGERYAYEDAFKKLWHLEGYLLCERLRGDLPPARATGSDGPVPARAAGGTDAAGVAATEPRASEPAPVVRRKRSVAK